MNPRCDYNKEENKMMTSCPPIYECPEERVCERIIMHEVPQD